MIRADQPADPRPRRGWFVLVAVFAVLMSGCAEELEIRYGRRLGYGSTSSVNGTAVLADMFEQAGHKVNSWRWLSPTLEERADYIVWFPDDFEPPSQEVIDWLERWLEADSARVLVYVGRDYDAEARYWQNVSGQASGKAAREVTLRLREAQQRFHFERDTGTDNCPWFTLDHALNQRSVTTLQGPQRWVGGVDPTKVEIELNGRLIPRTDATPLLTSEGDTLVSSFRPGPYSGRVILVANGSFLLNVPLVNHEHRKLAAALIEEVGPPGNTVFLESGAGGPVITDKDPEAEVPTGLEAFSTPPLDMILLHGAALGLLIIIASWPIFGRPVDPEAAQTVVTSTGARTQIAQAGSDFGVHAQALGKLLERTGDVGYAQKRLEQYRQHVRHQPGSS